MNYNSLTIYGWKVRDPFQRSNWIENGLNELQRTSFLPFLAQSYFSKLSTVTLMYDNYSFFLHQLLKESDIPIVFLRIESKKKTLLLHSSLILVDVILDKMDLEDLLFYLKQENSSLRMLWMVGRKYKARMNGMDLITNSYSDYPRSRWRGLFKCCTTFQTGIFAYYGLVVFT